MAKADDFVEAHVFLLQMNPITTPQLTEMVLWAVHTAAVRISEPTQNFERALATLLATALQKLVAERTVPRSTS